ncbi:glutamate--tRNA ligase [Thermoleophilum album]|jgi:glutamyl-tRNA synthetase|uniref:glutamate--tRNA ligase n=1 Tax=Thermoleophilum album TaxID=29539 RepID=UPI00237CB007|nr:glutamate--tRNA ligase [Thermoleophilum album]WDT94476.1 glutamate--tRNA ligase [Thermoleophilum album]
MRVRFAPSPTGELHVGGARTALYNWLLARGSGGAFVLRIEDTDRERSTRENRERILEALRWLELDWDEGPFSQAERADRHNEAIEQLLRDGHAYEDEGAVRFRVPPGETVVEDLIRGPIRFPHDAIKDFVIRRSDGSPLYNLAVAVDDLDMAISHVVRGDDHLSNTPRQLMVIRALGYEPPAYAHLPLLHGPDGKKLSKRHGATSVEELRARGYLPEAVRNYLALLGWGLDDRTTFIDTETLIEHFSLARVSRSPAVFDEKKLRWMNGHYLRKLPLDELVERLVDYLDHEAIVARDKVDREKLRRAAEAAQEKLQTLADFWPLAGFVLERREPAPELVAWLAESGARERLERARERLAALDDFSVEAIQRALRALVEELGVKGAAVFQPLRVAVTGSKVSPGIFESLAALGRDETLARIDAVLGRLAAASVR